MKTNFVAQDSNTTFVINTDGESWLFEDGHNFTSAAGPAIDAGQHSDVEIILEGHAAATASGGRGAIDSMGSDAMVIVTETGSVEGDGAGIALHGTDAEIDNRGRIEGGYVGVNALGESFYLANRGVIEGGTHGVYMSGSGSALTNYAGAEIHGMVTMSSAAGASLWLNNDGVISASTAVYGGDSNDIIHNTGELHGSVSLGAGNDVLDTRWGTLSETSVAGGLGDDLLITSRADYVLNEAAGQGTDTVKANVSYTLSANVEKLVLFGNHDILGVGNDGDNEVYGNAVDNRLYGAAGNDTIDGGRGNDRLEGDAGMDTFVFSSGYDLDRIVDFTHGEDTIDLSGWAAVGSFNAFLSHAEDHGNNVWVIAGQDMLVIKGHQLADMDANDFTF